MICTFATATTLVLEISDNSIAVVFDTIVYVEVNAYCTLTGEFFQIIIS
jgi:hypothetical protein